MTRKLGGHPAPVVTTYDTIQAWQITSVGTSQVAASAQSIPCYSVLIQASHDNTDRVLVGTQAEGCFVELRAGDSFVIPVNNVNKVFVRALSGTQTVNGLALR